MALPILDGNQTAVTLATTVSGSQHYPNHIIASGTITANVVGFNPTPDETFGTGVIQDITDAEKDTIRASLWIADSSFNNGTAINGQILSQNYPMPVVGTVTANSSNGSLTTRFGSVTTANTAFSTTAVTNASRKYLLIQNISSGVITAGIGFTPTTTQGIQLSAGALITYDGNYIPTGAVRILSSVTASNFTVLEA
jgi:hypothetical protein